MRTFGRPLLDLWSLDPDATYLNHGAYGATPRVLRARQDAWRARMETQPTRFLMDETPDLLREAAAAVARFVGADAARTVLLDNVTAGISAVLRSLAIAPGERLVTTSHVYGAVRNAMRFVAERSGALAVEVAPTPETAGPSAIAEAVVRELDGGARLLVVDHVTSPSALVLPVRTLVDAARARGVPVLVDGSHAPGLLDLDVGAIDADWYVGSLHKWLCAPKGGAFLVAREGAEAIRPLAISHAAGQGFTAEFGKVGTRDPSALLTAPDAIAFHEELGGRDLRARNATLAARARDRLAAEAGLAPFAAETQGIAMVSGALPLDAPADWQTAQRLRRRLWETHRVEALVVGLHGRLWLRTSWHAYTDESDLDRLVVAVRDLIEAEGGRC